MKLANIKLKNNIILAPIASYTDLAFRILCRRYGAGFAYVPMVSAEGVIRKNKLTSAMLKPHKDDMPRGVQLFGNNPDKLAKAAAIIESHQLASLIDINLGCPAAIIGRQGCGVELLKKPELIKQVIEAVVDAVSIPVTAKIRILKSMKKTLEIAAIIERAGAATLAVHARTPAQGYSGRADWPAITEIKKNAGIPIIGNGDIVDGKSAEQMLSETGCDFVMVGRTAMGNPRVFDFRKACIEKTDEEIKQEKIKEFFNYLMLCEQTKTENFLTLKQQALVFASGFRGCVDLRREITKAKSKEELIKTIKS